VRAKGVETDDDEPSSEAVVTEPLLISVDQLADLLQVSTRTCWRLLSASALPQPIHVGSSVRWRMAEVKQWISEGCPTPVESG